MSNYEYVRSEDAPILDPPRSQRGIFAWLWENIFSSMSNFSTISASLVSIFMIITTFTVGYVLVMGIWSFLDFTVFSAIFSDPDGVKREVCLPTVYEDGTYEHLGACWPFITEWFRALMIGNKFPGDESWRVYTVYTMLAIGVIWLVWERAPKRSWAAIFMLVAFPIISFVLLNGSPMLDNGEHSVEIVSLAPLLVLLFLTLWYLGRQGYFSEAGIVFAPIFGVVGALIFALWFIPIAALGLDISLGTSVVPTRIWGGLLITLVVAIAGIIASLPIGVLLALGRQSNAVIIKYTCIFFIEVVRGIPLILVLFFAAQMLPYFLDSHVDFNKLLRALVGVALFASAYMAEVIRGGLQAIPKGQYEGGMSLGLSYWQQMRLIVLPQAITIVIPGIVNTFIGLFKDTSLVIIIGIFDLLGLLTNTALKDIDWYAPSTPFTGYVFVAGVYFLFCFGMSRYSVYMERKLDRGH